MRLGLTVVVFALNAAMAAPACGTPEACFDAGVKLFVNEDYKEAGQAFERAVELEPQNAEYLIWQGRAWGRRAERASGFAKLGAFSLARRVRECNPEVRVLFVSGYTENGIVHQGRLEPGVRLLQKPFTRRGLLMKVHEALSEGLGPAPNGDGSNRCLELPGQNVPGLGRYRRAAA